MRRLIKTCDRCGKDVDYLYRLPKEFDLYSLNLIPNERKGEAEYCIKCAENLLTKLNNVLKFKDGE